MGVSSNPQYRVNETLRKRAKWAARPVVVRDCKICGEAFNIGPGCAQVRKTKFCSDSCREVGYKGVRQTARRWGVRTTDDAEYKRIRRMNDPEYVFNDLERVRKRTALKRMRNTVRRLQTKLSATMREN